MACNISNLAPHTCIASIDLTIFLQTALHNMHNYYMLISYTQVDNLAVSRSTMHDQLIAHDRY